MFFVVGFIFLHCRVAAQNENTKWYFGNHVALDFMTNPPIVLNNSQMNTSEGCSSIADAAGNLLFYTDGVTVWNKQHLSNGKWLRFVGARLINTIFYYN
ncbi:MAG: hypothetical protein KF900_12450 [Bacteroidetes bacterium]|nr:hypothetical protein [Bacteroidota bacterium]